MQEQHTHTHAQNRFAVIPTAARLGAHPDRTGKGVTIAFLDAGFYPHPDLSEPECRILAYEDVTQPVAMLASTEVPQGWDWHGTQTSVTAAGNGHLSNGIYRGLACESYVVLVKVSDRGKITEENIARGLEWVIANKDRYNIRIVSISLGGDKDVPSQQNKVDQLAEEVVRQGIVVVVAAGNSGCTDRHHTVPPANASSVITVGGYDDMNRIDNSDLHLYCSSFGPTADGIIKPEVIAPAIWVAAPILPNTSLYSKAEALSQLAAAADYQLSRMARDLWQEAGLSKSIHREPAEVIRATVESLLQQDKIVATHYQHVDGTSFAAPIVASLVAQMLEANPELTPAAIKQTLIATATRIQNAPLMRQGYGVINAHAAVEQAMREQHTLDNGHFSPPRIEGNKLIFFYHDDSAESVTLAGDFNGWNPEQARFAKESSGIWKTEIQLPDAGRYRYKFVVGGNRWIDDPSNGMKEPDGYGGFNSIVSISTNETNQQN